MYKSIRVLPIVALVIGGYVSAATIEKSEDKKKDSVGIKPGLELDIKISLGYDSNVYRTPSAPYIDYGKTCDPAVVPNCEQREDGEFHQYLEPDKQSGVVIPAELKLNHYKATSKKNYLKTYYKFLGGFYPESKFDNANVYHHKFRFGDEYVYSSTKKKQDTVYGGVLLENKKRLYLDRDSGEEQTSSGGADISERYTYTGVGLEGKLKSRTGKLLYEVDATIQDRDYEDPVVVSEYDHLYYKLGGELGYWLVKSSKLSLGYDYYIYDYKERPSRSADGSLPRSNPAREYVYNKLDISLRQKFTKSLYAYFDYQRKTRDDQYVGYDNYTKDLIKTRIHYKLNKANRIKLTLAYWERDYDNAYAFDNQAIGIKKQYDGVDARFIYNWQFKKNLTMIFDVWYIEENSTDLRYDYDRVLGAVGVNWEY